MGSIGLPEILVVLVVALIVLGPTRLPEAARQVGRALSEFRRVSSGLQAEVREAFSEPPPNYPPSKPTVSGPPRTEEPTPNEPPPLPQRPEDAEIRPDSPQ